MFIVSKKLKIYSYLVTKIPGHIQENVSCNLSKNILFCNLLKEIIIGLRKVQYHGRLKAPQGEPLIGDIANSKCHQWLDHFYPHYIREISKVVYKKIKPLSCNMPAKLDAILCDQHVLVIIAYMGFIQHMPDKSFLVNNLANFPDVRVKNI